MQPIASAGLALDVAVSDLGFASARYVSSLPPPPSPLSPDQVSVPACGLKGEGQRERCKGEVKGRQYVGKAEGER